MDIEEQCRSAVRVLCTLLPQVDRELAERIIAPLQEQLLRARARGEDVPEEAPPQRKRARREVGKTSAAVCLCLL